MGKPENALAILKKNLTYPELYELKLLLGSYLEIEAQEDMKKVMK